jgi:hypothetical protein
MLLSSLAIAGEQKTFPTIDRLNEILTKYKVDAKTITKENSIRIEYDAMDYHVHVPNRMGRMQEKWILQRGPHRKGIVIDIEINDEKYNGPRLLPQKLPQAYSPYFETYVNDLPESGKYLYIRAKFGSTIDLLPKN